jgi:hypothetical protein
MTACGLRILVLCVSIGVLLTFVFLVEYRDGCRAESREKESHVSFSRSTPPRTARAREELDSSWFRSSSMSYSQEAPREGVNPSPPNKLY